MNQALSAPFRAVGHALRAGGSVLNGVVRKSVSSLSLVPTYLSGLLWLLTQQFLDLAQNAYAGNAAVYACLRLLSNSIAEPPLLAYTTNADGTQGDRLPHSHPLQALIRQPNELTSQVSFWMLAGLQMGIAGRSHWWKERDNSGQTIALWPLRPDRMGPIYYTGTQAGERVIQGWSYLVPGSTPTYLPLARQDVLTFLWPNPAGDSGGLAEGLGPLQVLAAEVGADNEATRFVGALVANYAMPGVIVATKNSFSSVDEAKVIKAGFKQDFGGLKRGDPAIVDGDVSIIELGFNLQQLEFPALRRVSESRIAAAFGTPAILVGLQVGLESGIRATIAEQRQYFTETTLATLWRLLQDQYTQQVALEWGEMISCAFDQTKVLALQETLRTQAMRIESAFERGAVTIDEYRKAVLNLEPLPNGTGAVRILPKGATEIDEHNQVIGTPEPLGGTAAGSEELDGATAPTAKTTAKTTATAKTPPVDEEDEDETPPQGKSRGNGRSYRAARARITVSAKPTEDSLHRHRAALAAWEIDNSMSVLATHV